VDYSVGQVAGFAGVTVRTLHHYDEIGLLSPGRRTGAGHRRYTDADLDRLQRVLFYRELGFPLEEVASLLDDPEEDPAGHLRRQHKLLTGRIERLRKMATAVERAMEAQKMGINLTPEEKFEVFGDFDPDEYADEAERRWGHTEAWAESQRKAASYTKEDWKAFREEMDGIHRRIAGLLAEGVPADAPEAMDLAEEHRRFISRTSYECGHEMHRRLGEMYVADERFAATYEAIRPGLAVYMRDVIAANAENPARTG
jgi:DNA-binding transcriptional MerR regulator